MSEFGELLAELRQDRKLTQRDLAHILHVSVGTISNYENSVHFPDVEKLIELADFFGVTTDYLLGRCESPFSPDVFTEQITRDRKAGEILKLLRQLPAENKNALDVFLGDAEFRMTVQQHIKKEPL